MARRCWVLTGPASSTGSPMTFMMRPSVSSPTGTEIGSPVSVTSWPRTRPSVDVHGDGAHRVLAEMLGDLEDEPVAVVLGLERVQDRRQVPVELHVDHGAGHLGDAARMTPLTFGCACGSSPWCLPLSDTCGSERLGARDDLDQFLGDLRLAAAVVVAACSGRSCRRRCAWRCPWRSSWRPARRRRSRGAPGRSGSTGCAAGDRRGSLSSSGSYS